MGNREKLRENIDLNSSDSTSVRGGSTATIRSGAVDSFLKSASAYYSGEGDTQMADDVSDISLKSARVRKAVKKHAGKEHTTIVQNQASAPSPPSKEVPAKESTKIESKPVNRKEQNGRPTLSQPIKESPSRGNDYDVYGEFKTAYNQAVKQDMMEDAEGNQER